MVFHWFTWCQYANDMVQKTESSIVKRGPFNIAPISSRYHDFHLMHMLYDGEEPNSPSHVIVDSQKNGKSVVTKW